MGRMKPAALLLRSKKKKGPARLSATVIVAVNVVVVVVLLSVYFTAYRPKGIAQSRVGGDEVGIELAQGNGSSPYAVLNTTRGEITLQLLEKLSPKIVEEFVVRGQKGYYDGGMFHRIVKGFMIQGGLPVEDGTQGQPTWAENLDDEARSGSKLKPYTVAMPNPGSDQAGGSQFFITTVGMSYLDSKFAVFGSVVRGQEVVQDIENLPTDSSDRPLTPVLIHNINIIDSL